MTFSSEPPFVDMFSLRNKKHDLRVTVRKAPRMLHFVKGGLFRAEGLENQPLMSNIKVMSILSEKATLTTLASLLSRGQEPQ